MLAIEARPKYPYPGLRPFEADEWSIFFGRERMIDDVFDRLAVHRLVLIHGSSGAGKSSLVRAGVLPKLARQHRRAGAPWRTCTMRPSGGPLWNLATELARLDGDADAERIGSIVGRFNRRGATLSAVAGSLKNLEGRRLCILVDQFEELFRSEKETSRDEAELFVDLLVRSDVEAADGAATSDRQAATVHIIVTMRSEFLGDCARFSGLAETINRTQYLVPRMDHDDLLRAIRRPAQLYGGEVKLDLAERLIADAGGREDELPLIQHGLMLMWHEAVAKVPPGGKTVLDAAPLEAAGGLSRMLSAHANAAVDAAAPDPQRRYAVERMFRALTDVNVEGNAVRRPQAFQDLVAVTDIDAASLHGIVDALRRDGVSFLTPYHPQPIGDTTPIDIGHEALIRCWDRLADAQDGWLKREFDDGLIWRSLVVEARSFEHDRRRVLSPATTDERSDWWRERKVNGAWAERYGGNFGLVEKLLVASRRSAGRQRLLQYAFIGLLLCISCAGVAYASWNNRTRLQMLADIYLWHTVQSTEQERALNPKREFKECETCPAMIVIPAGEFVMGSATGAGNDVEHPAHTVTILTPFAVSKFEVTFEQFDVCYELGGCQTRPYDYGWGRGNRPVIYVSWQDAQEYVIWLSNRTGKQYRLLSEAEYEYAVRAGSLTVYPWGDEIGKNNANCDGCGSEWGKRQTAPVGSFATNQFGLGDTVGNVWEWVMDCAHPKYVGAPANGAPWVESGNCSRVVRGGSWLSPPLDLRSASRDWLSPDTRDFTVGFRVARTIAR
jgi:formylglycine-generating enzyme required for sulfatase activity